MDLADGHIAALRKLFTADNIGKVLAFSPYLSILTIIIYKIVMLGIYWNCSKIVDMCI